MTTTPFSEKLRLLRAQRGLTLTEAAQKIGVTRGTLASLEKGSREPQMPTLFKISEAYQIPVLDLRGREDTASPRGSTPEDVPHVTPDDKLIEFAGAGGVLLALDAVERGLTEKGYSQEKVFEWRSLMLGGVITEQVSRAYNQGYAAAMREQAEQNSYLDQPPPQVSPADPPEEPEVYLPFVSPADAPERIEVSTWVNPQVERLVERLVERDE
jgi:transcriptional regulator with XRE-family HTH domain